MRLGQEEPDWTLTAECEAKCLGPTGVEMEALTGAAVAALTIYDMCKAVNKLATIENICLVSVWRTEWQCDKHR